MKSNKPLVAIVIPTIRSLDFLDDWQSQFISSPDYDIEIIICEDHPKKEIPTPKLDVKISHFSWKEIDADLGKNSWIIPRKVSAIRNYGFIKAVQNKADAVITLDDDCYPIKNHHLIKDHLRNLSLSLPARWINTYPDDRHLYTRGVPYLIRQEMPVKLSHGLWNHVLDHDGPTQLQHLSFKAEFAEHMIYGIPSNAYFPMCSMNLAFSTEITALMYFPLMGEDNQGKSWGYNRFDDIWAGIFAKKVLDHLRYGVINGAPFIRHKKASDPFKNLQKEATGIEMNEEIWKLVDEVKLTKSNPADCYIELAKKIKFPKTEYFKKLPAAMVIWGKLFQS